MTHRIFMGADALEMLDTIKRLAAQTFEPLCALCRRKGRRTITGYVMVGMETPRDRETMALLFFLTSWDHFYAGDQIFIPVSPCAGHLGYIDGISGRPISSMALLASQEKEDYGNSWRIGHVEKEAEIIAKTERDVPKGHKTLESIGL